MTVAPSQTPADLVLARPGRARVLERLGLDSCCGGRRGLARLAELARRTVAAHAAGRPELEEARDVADVLRQELEAHIEDEERRLFPAFPRARALRA